MKIISMLTVALFAGNASAATELFTNSTFQTSAFDTDYAFGDLHDVTTVGISSSPTLLHASWASFGSQFGTNMLMVNGAVDSTKAVWSQSVNLTSGTSYNFSLSAASTYSENPASLKVVASYGAGSTADLGTLVLDSNTGSWKVLNSNVDLSYTGAVTFKLYDLSQQPSGNDFAIEQVSLTAAVPEPETYAMMLAGLGLVGFMARRKKGVPAAR